jgi:hypothetical protein
MFHKKQHKFVKLQIPYAMKLNIHDFMGMGMSVRLKPEVRKLVYDKYMAGEQFENLLMEFDDIIEQQNAKAEEYLKQSLVEQLAKEKAEQKMGEGDMNDEALDDINSQVEQLRQEKLDSLNALNQPEMDTSGTQQHYELSGAVPQPFSPLQTPDVGDFTLDGVGQKTSFGGQDFGVINLNKPGQGSQSLSSQMGGNNSLSHQINQLGNDMLMTQNQYMPHMELGPSSDNIQTEQMGGGTTQSDLMMSMDTDMSVPDINISGLDDGLDLGNDLLDVTDVMSSSSGQQGGSQGPMSNNGNQQSGGEVKQVTFDANAKEMAAMGL